ncbi:MAG TPA: VWA domain-containing protein, partial [Candidatus Acidoferrales bacterium]
MKTPTAFRGPAAVLCIFALASAGAGQAPPGKQEAVIRATSRLVVVDVVVHDRNGAPVTDLTREDFTILEDRKPHEISVFSLNRTTTVENLGEPQPPLTYSNRASPGSAAPASVTIILVDALNTNFGDQSYAREQILDFLDKVQPTDRVALYALGTTLTVLHDFTSETTLLRRALRRHQPRNPNDLGGPLPTTTSSVPPGLDAPPGGMAGGPQTLGEFLEEAARNQDNFQIDTRVRRTLWALEAIANHVVNVPGRKNLVWVSSGIPFAFGQFDLPAPLQVSRDRQQYYREIERASRAVNNANLAIYPVDARGLIGAVTDPNFNAPGNISITPTREFGGGQGAMPVPMTTLADIAPTQDTMRMLAENTGGRVFLNTNDISGAIRSAVEDTRATYTLGYSPTHGRWDGRFVNIRVQVNRPGVQVRHRRGYYALPDASAAASDRQAALREAALSPLGAAALAIQVRLLPGAKPPLEPPPQTKLDGIEWPPRESKRKAVEYTEFWDLLISAEPREMVFRQERDRWVGTLDVMVTQRLPDASATVTWN